MLAFPETENGDASLLAGAVKVEDTDAEYRSGWGIGGREDEEEVDEDEVDEDEEDEEDEEGEDEKEEDEADQEEETPAAADASCTVATKAEVTETVADKAEDREEGSDPEVRDGSEEGRETAACADDDGDTCGSSDKDFDGWPTEAVLPRGRASIFDKRAFASGSFSDRGISADDCMDSLAAPSDGLLDDVESFVHWEEASEYSRTEVSEDDAEEGTQTAECRPDNLARAKIPNLPKEPSCHNLIKEATCPATSSRPSAPAEFVHVKRGHVSSPTANAAGNHTTGAGGAARNNPLASAPAVLLFVRTVAGGKPSLAKFLLLDGPIDIGRRVSKLAAVNNGVLTERSVSRNHAILYYKPEEESVYICDLGSLHGTFVNGTRIYSPTVLRSGDLLRFGQAFDVLAHFEVRVVRDVGNTWAMNDTPAPVVDIESATAAHGKELMLVAEDASNGKKRGYDAAFSSESALDDIQERISEDLASLERRVRRKITVTSAISSLVGGLIGGVSVGAALFGLSQLDQ